ncbi:hypothetical protein B0H14DRAFT_3163182, partial [Mycena olivaceomarginata]
MVNLCLITLSAAAIASAIPIPRCALDTVQYLFWVDTLGSILQSSRDNVTGGEALGLVGILNDADLALTSAVAMGNSVIQSGFITDVSPAFDALSKLLPQLNHTAALSVFSNAQSAARNIS